MSEEKKITITVTWDEFMDLAKAIGLLDAKISYLKEGEVFGNVDLSLENYESIRNLLLKFAHSFSNN